MSVGLFPRLPTSFTKARRSKFGVSSLLFFLLFGGFWLAIIAPLALATRVDSGWERVSGKVIEVRTSTNDDGTTYSPVVEYYVDSSRHVITSSVSTGSAPQIGGSQEVAYDPENPFDAKVVQGSGLSWIIGLFVAVGVIMITIGPILYVRSLRRSRAVQMLVDTGQKVQGIVVDVRQASGKEGSYKIVVAAPSLSGTTEHYTSDAATGIGGLTMADFQGNPIPIDVYIDPINPQNYYVDIDDIPALTPERIKELINKASGNTPGSPTGSAQ